MVDSLKLVELVDGTAQPIDGLVSVRRLKSTDSPHEHAILLQAATFDHVDHVFFRRFKDSEGKHVRSSQVLAYVVDNSQQRLTENELATLHHKLWLHGVAPLIYVAWPTRVDILTCARKPDFWAADDGVPQYHPAAQIETAGKIAEALQKRFSAYRLAEGTFWDDSDNQKLAKDDAAAHRSLIQAIVEADRELDGEKKPLRRRLLVLMVLIKYLEDRGVFPSGHFGRFHAGARSFRDILREGTVDEVLRLLRYFENKFNGDVFSLGDDGEKLTKSELQRFARLVGAKELGGQNYFWELFSFEHIPVEVISRLYQRFVTGHGAVYTPQFLASLLLDQVMPYDRLTGKEKVLDPACGSGIFLVGAFKRLVIHWRSRHDWRKPTVEDLKRILAHSIHGVELEAGAVDLTAFSLALAICDALEPPVIWSDLKLDKLRGRNLREGDFFDPVVFVDRTGHIWPTKFDVVIGNPPFGSKLTAAANAVIAARPKESPNLPDKQSAYLFLEHAFKSTAPQGSVCLLQPHGLIYNSNPIPFCKHLMNLCDLHTVLDFVSIRGMFEGKDRKGADAKAIAWHAVQDATNNGRCIKHLTLRRTYSAKQRITFEIDHYDWHEISPSELSENPFLWRAGLLGGGRLRDISSRLRKMDTLRMFIERKGWLYSEGFKLGVDGKPAAFLTGKLHLPTEALTLDGIDETQLRPLGLERVERPRDPDLYEPPMVVIGEHDSLPVDYWDQSHLNFMRSIVGIHGNTTDHGPLQSLVEEIKTRRRLFQFCFVLNGTRALTGRSTAINKLDIDRLPFPHDSSELDLAFWEDALKEDVLNHMADYVRLGQDSDLLTKPAETNHLREFAALYVRMLGSLYRNLHAHEPIYLNGLIAQPFYFGPRPDVSWLGADCEESLHKLIYDESRESLRTIRVVRYYEGNVILIVKPDRLRYWIRSTAIRDADDTLVDLREQGW